MKKVLAWLLVLVLAMSLVACSNSDPSANDGVEKPSTNAPAEKPTDTDAPDNQQERVGGKILYLSNMNSGPQYEGIVAYLEMAFDNMGYKLEVVFGDPANDPAGNLNAVKNSMTNDVVGLIACQDGGIAEIMAEYPELYVVGFLCDMASVYDEGGANASCLTNDHFLGAMADQCVNGAELAQMYFDVVVEKGYQKVATMSFPPFAYPRLMAAAATFGALAEEYNKTAEKPIEVVGEIEVLMFEPLSDAYFMDASHQDLDCIVAPLEGISFVYPALKAAIEAGTINPDTKLVTSGTTTDESVLADFGDDGVITSLINVSVESVVWPIVLLDNAIQGKQFADYTAPEQISSALFVIDSKEDLDTVMEKSMYTEDAANAVTNWEKLQSLLTFYNENATYAALKEYITSDALSVEGLK